MKVRLPNELLIINVCAILVIIIITFFPSSVLRVILGLPFILFFPGYTLVAALFPRKTDLDSIGRVALSFGLSVAVVPLTGLALNYTPWGIRLYPALISLVIFIAVISVVAWHRRHKLPKEERFTISFSLSLPPWREQNILDKVLSIVLILAVLGAMGSLGHALVKPKVGENLTEFYILEIESKAANYPRQLVVGQEGKVIVGIANSEHEAVSYRVVTTLNGIRNSEIGSIVLEHNEKWEQEVSFIPKKAGENQRVEFLLYKDGEVGPCLDPLYLWIDVKE